MTVPVFADGSNLRSIWGWTPRARRESIASDCVLPSRSGTVAAAEMLRCSEPSKAEPTTGSCATTKPGVPAQGISSVVMVSGVMLRSARAWVASLRLRPLTSGTTLEMLSEIMGISITGGIDWARSAWIRSCTNHPATPPAPKTPSRRTNIPEAAWHPRCVLRFSQCRLWSVRCVVACGIRVCNPRGSDRMARVYLERFGGALRSVCRQRL